MAKKICNRKEQTMTDKELIKETITSVNQFRDFGMWERLEGYFIDVPYVDDEDLTKEMPGLKSVKHLINTWRKELKTYFYATRHSVKSLRIKQTNKKEANVVTETDGQYFITDKGDRYVLTVRGTYSYKLVKRAGIWKIGQIRFSLKEQNLRPIGAV
jgi:hypothetical protein